MSRLEVGVETGAKKVFVWAVDWPGWCRGARDRDAAMTALLAAAGRYAAVVRAAGLDLPSAADDLELVVMDEVEGGAATDFGVPSVVAPSDRRPLTPADAQRQAALVEAAWSVVDRVAAEVPAILRKGPRGGGRDRDALIDHVLGADHAYAREMGIRLEPGSRDEPSKVLAERTAVLAVLRQPSDGSPIAGRKWPPRYAARRVAWHALDHAWEMQDRSDP